MKSIAFPKLSALRSRHGYGRMVGSVYQKSLRMTRVAMEHHFFVFGSFPAISRAELVNLVGCIPSASVLAFDASGAVVSGLSDQSAINLFQRLGGSIKVAAVNKSADAQLALQEVLDKRFLNEPVGSKFLFGLSGYGQNLSARMLFGWGLELKKKLKAQGRSSRLVTSTEAALSSVVVQKNQLTTTGSELIVAWMQREYWVGHTLAVQEFEQWGQRDMERPRRNARRGMLPPKIARIMVNLSRTMDDRLRTTANDVPLTILDPFCGGGTILMEASQLGYAVIGSDMSKEAVEDTKENLEWFLKSRQSKVVSRKDLSNSVDALQTTHYKLLTSDVRDLSRHIKPQSVDAIVTEPDLGPPQARLLRSEKEIERIREKLSGLYLTALAQFSSMLKHGGRVVISLPVWHVGGQQTTDYRRQTKGRLVFSLDRLSTIEQLGFRIIPPSLSTGSNNVDRSPLTVVRPALLYGRPEQFVWREILVLEKRANT